MISDSYLSTNGYCIPKANITQSQFNIIKKELTVIPMNIENTSEEKEKAKYKIYSVVDDIIRIPRYYGIEKFGVPKTTKFLKNKPAKIKFNGTLRDYQIPIVETCLEHMRNKGGGLLVVPCGTGKCHTLGTKIMMYDGQLKNVENVVVGDQLMGDDSTPRNVLSLARGQDFMYNVITPSGESYGVNTSHILSLKYNGSGLTIDMSVDQYLNSEVQDKLYGFRVGVNFDPQRLYTSYISVYNELNGLDKMPDPYICGLCAHTQLFKYIPCEYKYGTREIRVKFLAGLIDGSECRLSDCKNGLIILHDTVSVDCIIFLTRSLGYNSYASNKDVCIFGDFRELYTLTKTTLPVFKPNQHYLNYKIKIEPIGFDNYYGFELDGNHRYVLGDFTVTHNTSMAIYIASILKCRTLIVTHKTFLLEQWVARCRQFTNSSVGIIRQKIVDIDGKDFVVAMIQSLAKRKYDPEIFKHFDLVVCDETHHFSSRCFSQALGKCSAKYTMGLTATPYRGDGLMHVVNWFLGDTMYEKRIKTNNQVVTKIITFNCNDKLFTLKKRWIKGSIRPDCVKMINNLVQIEQRNQHIATIINTLRKTGERKILILSGRKDHLNDLKERVDQSIAEDIKNGLALEDENLTYFYTGDTKKNERFEAEQYADILFATYEMAHEGLDIDRLNTIILATPKPDVNQAVGRILRKVLENGDVRPLVIDIVDKLSVFVSHGEKREKFYEKSKYVQQYYYLLNDKFISPYAYLKLCGELNEDLSKEIPESFDALLDVPPVDISYSIPDVSDGSESCPKKRGKKIKKYVDEDQFMF